jgi:hypothetical protein
MQQLWPCTYFQELRVCVCVCFTLVGVELLKSYSGVYEIVVSGIAAEEEVHMRFGICGKADLD